MELTKLLSIEEVGNKRKAILNAYTPDKIKPSFLDKRCGMDN
jgi:hypothetical protein